MRVDVVASPVRYRRTPLFLLLAIAVVPALGLLVAQRWLVGEADQYDNTRAAVEALSITTEDQLPTTRRELERAERAAVLSTSVLDYRRVPDGVARSASTNQLETELENVLPFLNADSCAAISVDGTPVGEVNENLSVIPASAIKLITAAVALEVLGPDYTFKTTVRLPAVDENGTVDGDLYLVGGGDPLLTSNDYPIEVDTYPAFSTTSLDLLADQLSAAGVRRITGMVIGDGTRYDNEFAIAAWGDDVGPAEAGPYDALLVNDARVLGRVGVQSDPNAAAAREFQRLLSVRGIRVNNGAASGFAPPLAPVVATVESEPLSEVVREMLTNSDNNTAEMLLKEIGLAGTGQGNRFAGLGVVESTLSSWGIPLDGVRLLDGSGLTPANQVTCAALLGVLQRSRGTSLATSLPIAGQTGTLRDEFVNTDIAGRLFAKTGTLGNPPADLPPLASKALAGYVPGGNDNTIEFVLILNETEITDEVYRLFWALFTERFATFPDAPEREDLIPR